MAQTRAARRGHHESVTETPTPRRSPYAVPYDRFAADSHVDRHETVVEQPHDPPQDVPDAADGGDGD